MSASAKFFAITNALIAQLAALLPQVEYNPEWMGKTGYFDQLVEHFDVSVLTEGTVYHCRDQVGRHLFVVNHNGKAQVVFERYYEPDNKPDSARVMVFQGSTDVCEIIEANSECGEIGLSQLGAFFSFFGPAEAHELVLAAVEQAEAAAQANETTALPDGEAGEEPVDPTVRLRQRIAEREAGLAARQAANDPGKFIERRQNEDGSKTLIVRTNTTPRKLVVGGSVGVVAGLAVYGALKLISR